MEVQAIVMSMPWGPYPIRFFDDRVADALFLQGGGGGQAGDACADDEDLGVHGDGGLAAGWAG